MEKEALVASNLSYAYGSFQVFDNVSLKLYQSETLILSGSNGAGKTTFLLCLAGLLTPTSGKIIIGGYNSRDDEIAAKQRLAFVPDVPRFYQGLTTWEHLKFISLAHNEFKDFDERAEILLNEFGLWGAKDLYPHALSRGMRQKLAIVLALIRPFEILVMDEPASSLDKTSGENLKKNIIALNNAGVSIIISTHSPTMMNDINSRSAQFQGGKLEFS